MPTLPDLLTELDLSVAELHAAKLDGLLLPIASGFRSIDRPDGRAERAAAIARLVPDRMIVGEESAAWIWGALAEAPEPIRLSSRPRHRARLPPSVEWVTREMVIDEGDLAAIPLAGREPLVVTAPVRTAVDLARAATRPSAAAALRGMLVGGSVSADSVVAAIESQPRRPGRIAAIAAVRRADRHRDADQPNG